MAKQEEMLTLFSQYKAPQGFWLGDKTKVWIKAGKSQISKANYDSLMKDCLAFKKEISAKPEDSKIMVHTAKQEAKAENAVAKLEKDKAEMQKKIDNLQGQVQHLSLNQKPKPAAKPKGG